MTNDFLASAAQPQHLLQPGHALNKPEVLVAKISPEQEEELRQQFSGTQASRAAGMVCAAVCSHGHPRSIMETAAACCQELCMQVGASKHCRDIVQS